MKFTLIFTLLSLQLLAVEKFSVDNKMTSEKTSAYFTSGRVDDARVYKMTRKIILNSTLDLVLASVLNYDEKCNNDLKDERIFMDKKTPCKYHNKSLIESKIHKLEDTKSKKLFAVERRIYNRSYFSHVDLITMRRSKKQITIDQEMLKDKKAKSLIKNPVKRESAFLEAKQSYKITDLGQGKIELEFNYYSKTDHWLLNKSMVTSRVFNSIDQSVDLLFDSIKTNSNLKKVASTD